jgi:regulator of sirC expression with transglutaminase-like and TPR domain
VEPAQRFDALVNGPPSVLHLDVACALLAAAFTGIDRTDEVVAHLDALANAVPEPTFDGVLDVVQQRLTGNRGDYHDPRNSYLPDVLDRGLGLPITLSVVAIEVGRRAEVPVVGVGLPGHFIVGDGSGHRFGDLFNAGARYDRSTLRQVWPSLVGPTLPFDELHLLPVTERAILIRMLNNLRAGVLSTGRPGAITALVALRSSFVELAHEAREYPRWLRQYN